MRVLVIGAGIGGLALAHGLRRSGIDAQVFERRAAGGTELAGYGIHINAYGLRALEDCLPEANWQRFLAGSAPAPDVVTFYRPDLVPLLRRPGGPGRRRGIKALRDLVLDRIDGWSPTLCRLVRECEIGTLTAMPLRSMPHLDPWEPSPVTLIGDAVHNMTPMAGVGANTALRDADELRRALDTTAAGRTGLIDAIGGYETAMRAYANPAVAMSAGNARTAGSEARLPRLAFRTALRVAEAVPPMRRAMFRGATAAAGR
jgi:2-polyprenyl-6-methoxyphenol hydroxylase-like FAD-dependent oxidoreductase